MRNLVINKIHHLMKKNEKIFFLTADMGINLVEIFKNDYPKRYLNVGIAEQNLISIASGLANIGYIPVAYTISNFLIHRCFEQLRNDIVLHDYPIVLVGTSSGFDNASLGPTHHMVDDWGCLKNFENLEIYSPTSNSFAINKIEEVLSNPRQCFFRLAKGDFSHFNETKDFYYREGDIATKILYLSYGNLSKILFDLHKNDQKNILLLNKIHPIENKELVEIFNRYEKILVIEDHFPSSGVYSSMCKLKNENQLKARISALSPKNYDFNVGVNQEFYLKKNQIDYESLKNIK